MKKIFFIILICIAFKFSNSQDTVSFPSRITQFVKVDSVNEDTMYKRAYFYNGPHYKIVKNKKGKIFEPLWMTYGIERRSKDSFLVVGLCTIPYFFNCQLSNFDGRLECVLTIQILPQGFEYTIENMTHKSVDGTFDFGPLINSIPYPLSHYPSLYPLSLKCWTRVRQDALRFFDRIGRELTQKIMTGKNTSLE